jgi:hypothetical protein
MTQVRKATLHVPFPLSHDHDPAIIIATHQRREMAAREWVRRILAHATLGAEELPEQLHALFIQNLAGEPLAASTKRFFGSEL